MLRQRGTSRAPANGPACDDKPELLPSVTNGIVRTCGLPCRTSGMAGLPLLERLLVLSATALDPPSPRVR